MDKKTLDFKAEIKAENKSFEAYGATFGNVDHHNDVILKGAFNDTIQKRIPKLAYQHDVTKLVGVVKEVYEDGKGLKIKGDFLNTPLGLQVYEEVKAGAINQMSIGFKVNESEYDDKGTRSIKSVDLFEVSFVTFPANEQAMVTNVKTIRDFEGFLRDAGYSRNEAKRIALYGFNKKDEEREAIESDVLKKLVILNKTIKGL